MEADKSRLGAELRKTAETLYAQEHEANAMRTADKAAMQVPKHRQGCVQALSALFDATRLPASVAIWSNTVDIAGHDAVYGAACSRGRSAAASR